MPGGQKFNQIIQQVTILSEFETRTSAHPYFKWLAASECQHVLSTLGEESPFNQLTAATKM